MFPLAFVFMLTPCPPYTTTNRDLLLCTKGGSGLKTISCFYSSVLPIESSREDEIEGIPRDMGTLKLLTDVWWKGSEGSRRGSKQQNGSSAPTTPNALIVLVTTSLAAPVAFVFNSPNGSHSEQIQCTLYKFVFGGRFKKSELFSE